MTAADCRPLIAHPETYNAIATKLGSMARYVSHELTEDKSCSALVLETTIGDLTIVGDSTYAKTRTGGTQ